MMIENMRNRRFVNAILDQGLWLYFLSSLVFLVVSKGLNLGVARVAIGMAIIGAIALVLTQGRGEKNPFKKIISGILSLYKTTGYLGDTLSYSRLLALGMTTSIIGMVINIIASIASKGIPVIGYILMFAILIFGHTFNLLVGILGAFIHSARLQLVEFFTKFYEGGGKEFKPYRYETKYITIKGGI